MADVAMEVEFDADWNHRTHDLAHMRQQVAFAVVVAFGHHGAVHGEEHAVDRQRRLEIGHDLVTEGLIDLLHCPAGGLGEGAEAFNHLPTLGLGPAAPDGERRAEHRHVRAVAALAEKAGLLEQTLAGRDRREGIGLSAEAGRKDLFHWAGVLTGTFLRTLRRKSHVAPAGGKCLLHRSFSLRSATAHVA
jgi:hypothetical protein